MGKKKFDEKKRHHFGAWLRYLRKERRLSLEEAAQATKIPLATLSLWERTGNMANVARIVNLARVYRVNLNTLLRVDNMDKVNVTEYQLQHFYHSGRRKRAGFDEPELKPPPFVLPEIPGEQVGQ